MSMNYYAHNPSYYRSHHYAHQFNLPDSAMNNRKVPVYNSEMPQGKDAFLPSHKKHFQRAGYRSIISEEQIINHQSPEETNSPAKNRDYYRNLSIDDIEGATTNTLISQALKNRIKAKELFLRQQQTQKLQESRQRDQYYSMANDACKQTEAVSLMQRYKKEENYHQKHRVKTQNIASTGRFNPDREVDKISQYKNEIQQTEKDISELERRLEQAKQKVDQEKVEANVAFNPQNQRENATKAIVEDKQNSNSTLKLPHIMQNQQQRLNGRPKEQEQSWKQSTKEERKRSVTQPNEQQHELYPSSDKINEGESLGRAQLNRELKIEQSRMRRQQIRKLNPTYLSYGSSSLTNNARRVYL